MPRYHMQHWGGEHSCHGYWRNGVCVFGLLDIGTILASGQMIANKVRTDYDPILAPCLADIVERRRKEAGEAPVTTYSELLICQEMTNGNNGGWGNFLESVFS